MKNSFTPFQGKRISHSKVPLLANDLFLIHQAFYTFLAISSLRFNNQEHKEILFDELGLAERGRTKKYGSISHGELWLRDLGVQQKDLTLIPSEHVIVFQRLCYEACNDQQRGEALLSAIEHVAHEFVSEIGNVLRRSGYVELLSVDIHCDPEYGIEVHHARETDKFVENPYYETYQSKVMGSFLGLGIYFV